MSPPNADPAELVAALILNPKHYCAPPCLCPDLRDIPEIAEAIGRLGPPN